MKTLKPCKLALLFAFGACLPLSSFASGQDRGGADSITCDSGSILAEFSSSKNYNSEYILADIGNDSTNNLPIHLFDFADENDVFNSIVSFLEQTDSDHPGLGAEVKSTRALLNFQVVKKVPRLQTGIYVSVWKRLFGGCHRDQVAIQDFDSNTVFIQKKTHDKFSSLMKGLMILHEVFIHLEHKNSNDLVVMETNARARVKGLYEKPGFNKIVISALSKSSHKSIDGILSPWASLVISRESVHAANWAGLDQLLDYGMSPNVMINKGIHACSVPLITYALGEFTLYYPDPNFKILLDQLLSLGARLDQKDPYGRPASSVLIGPYFGYAVFQSLVAKGAPLDINQSACYPSSPKSSDELTFLDFYQGPYSSSADTAPIIDWLKSHGAKTGKELARKCSPPIDLFDNHNNVTDQCYFYLHDATVADDNPEVNNTRSVN